MIFARCKAHLTTQFQLNLAASMFNQIRWTPWQFRTFLSEVFKRMINVIQFWTHLIFFLRFSWEMNFSRHQKFSNFEFWENWPLGFCSAFSSRNTLIRLFWWCDQSIAICNFFTKSSSRNRESWKFWILKIQRIALK